MGGFKEGEGEEEGNCVDVDEWAGETDTCDDTTQTCENTTGSYTWACIAGYKENSDTDAAAAKPCVVENACIAGTHECDLEKQTCEDDANDEDGAHTCEWIDPCDGYSCDDIAASSCVSDDERNTACQCNADYEPHFNDGQEGSLYEPHEDTKFANDANVICWAVVECPAESCGDHACVVTGNDQGLPALYCKCNDGYSGDNVDLADADNHVCEDINECEATDSEGEPIHTCTDNQDCTNTEGSFECACKTGYKETEEGAETPCTLQNKCIAEPDHCRADDALCIDDPEDDDGLFTCDPCQFGASPNEAGDACVCKEDYTAQGDICVEIPTIATCDYEDTVVRCAPEQMSIHIPKCAFGKDDLDISELHLAGPNEVDEPATTDASCAATESAAATENDKDIITFVIAGTVSSKCNNEGKDDKDNSQLVYSNSVQYVDKQEDGPIVRMKKTKIDSSCEFETDFTVSLPEPISVEAGRERRSIESISQHIQLQLPELDGTVTVQMNGYEDNGFTTPITTQSVIQVPNPIFIKLEIDTDATNFNLQLKKCWATPSIDPKDEDSYVFIEDYCGDKAEIADGNLKVISNSATSEASFQISSFTFTDADSTDMYLHCSTRICDASIDDCSINCSNRRRRSVLRFQPEETKLYTMTSGPIHIVRN